jgi:UDP-N-acetylglucosamine 2-epimerase (non-hydrolysing)
MLDQVLNIFNINPDIDLQIMRTGQDLFDITSEILSSIKTVIKNFNPDIVVVHGDTTTAMATSLGCYYSNTPLCHVEAGLRTNNIFSPFPEEFNRQVVGKIAKWHFAPTINCKRNLIKEGILDKNILVTGNTVIDALKWMLNEINLNENKRKKISNEIDIKLNFNWKNDKFIIVTGHRRENFGNGIENICDALIKLAIKYKNFHFVYPVHLNPNIQSPVRSRLKNISNIHLIEPLEYDNFVYLLKHCYLVLTDSGGIQEEAPSLGKPVLVMRDVTERTEAVEAGAVLLVGAEINSIIKYVSMLIDNDNYYKKMSSINNPYGNGFASEKIVEFIKNQ